MKKENWALGLSILAIAISAGVICVAGYRIPELGFVCHGVLGGVVSLLVTVLIGWQIYSMLDAKKMLSPI